MTDLDVIMEDETEELPVVKSPVKKSNVENADETTSDTEDTEDTEEAEDEGAEAVESEVEVDPFAKPEIDAIEKKFPDVLKTFPQLKEVIEREAEYTSMFPTVEDAQEAFQNAEAFEGMRQDVLNGDGKNLFTALQNENKLESFAGQMLDTLSQVNPKAFNTAVVPVLERMVQAAYKAGESSGDTNLKHSALYLARFIFNDMEVAEGKKTLIPPKQDDSLRQERAQFEDEKSQSFRTSVERDFIKALNAKVEEKLDPDNTLTSFMKARVVEEVIKLADAQVSADPAHMRYMGTLWSKAHKEGRTDESKQRIISAYLARVSKVLPSVRTKVMAEVNGKRAQTATKVAAKVQSIVSRKDGGPSGRASVGGKSVTSAKEVNWDKTSDLDFLMDRITRK